MEWNGMELLKVLYSFYLVCSKSVMAEEVFEAVCIKMDGLWSRTIRKSKICNVR